MENKSPALLGISKRYLLSVYLILPFLMIVFLSDVYLFDSSLQPYMGLTSLALPLYLLFFELPHIIASFFSFADGEYLRYYKKQLFFYLPLLFVGTILLLTVSFSSAVVLYLVATVWHVLKQQTGIALILGARPGLAHTLWTIVPIGITSVVSIYFSAPELFPSQLLQGVSEILFGLVVLLLLVTGFRLYQAPKKVRLYILCVSSLFLVSYVFILSGYLFLAFFAVRFVHDVSAFAFYAVHDQNRNAIEPANFFYRLFKRVPLPIMVLTPVLAILFALLTRLTTDGFEIGYAILILVGMAHYYLESVMWKRDTPHRKYIKVT